MIDSKSKYKKVKQEQFGDRLTVDGQVFGIRPQKLIKRNEDVVFLAEAKGVVDNVHDDTILMDYPFYSDKVKFPTPPLIDFVDPEKFQDFKVSSQDVHMKTGGENPDTQALRRDWQHILDNREAKIRQLDSQLTAYEEQLKAQKQREKTRLQTRKETEQAKLPNIQKSYQNALSSIDKYVEGEEQSLAIREKTAKSQYEKKEISKEQYMELIAQIEYDRQEMYLTRYQRTQDANLTRDGSLQETNYNLYDLDFQISDIERKYRQLYDDKDADLKAQLSSYDEENYWPQVEPIYSASNFGAGIADNAAERQLDRDIAGLSVYGAVDGMYKSYDWNLGKNSTEYIDRLFADWEKLQFKKISNYSFKLHCKGVIEHYKGEDAGGYKWTYNRFLQGQNYIYYDYDYDNDPYDKATYDILDGTIDVRLGTRYDVGKIKNVYAVIQTYGNGVDGYGFGYNLVKLQRKGEVDAAAGKEFNDIEDVYYNAVAEIEKTYKEGVEQANIDYKNAVQQADQTYLEKIQKIEKDESSSIQTVREQYIAIIHPLVIEYNTMVYAGENPSDVLKQINQNLQSMQNRINSIKNSSQEAKNEASGKRSQSIEDADEEKENEMKRLLKEKEDAISDAEVTMSDSEEEFLKKINREYEDKRDAAFEKYDNAIDNASKEHDQAVEALAQQESALWDQLMESWKQQHGGEEPDDWSDPEVREHFESYFGMVETHAPIYNQLLEQMYNERCDAEIVYARDEADMIKFEENTRELWQFNGKQYAGIADNFQKKDQVYGHGSKTASVNSIMLLVAEMDYDWKMDVKFKDYEEEDRKHREKQDESQNN